MTKKTLHIGMIGYRFMGKAHSNAWRQTTHHFPLNANLQMTTLCGRNQQQLQTAAQQLGWQKTTTNWQDLINDPQIDIIDITTPNDTHAPIAIAAANAGKHILCEKPLALNPQQAQQMLQAAQKNNIIHMICHNYRRIPAIAHAKKMIQQGDLGTIYHYHARYAQDWITDPNFPLVWRLQKNISGSGAHGDINAHIIDLARYLVGELKEITGLMHTFIKQRPLENTDQQNQGLTATPQTKLGTVTVDDTAILLGKFHNGALANLEATRFALGRKNQITIEINASKGSLYFDLEDMNRLQHYDNQKPQDRQGFTNILITQPDGTHPYVGNWWPPGHIIGYEHTFIHTIADFIQAILDNKPTHPTFEDGLKNQQILQAVEQSAQTKQWTTIPN